MGCAVVAFVRESVRIGEQCTSKVELFDQNIHLSNEGGVGLARLIDDHFAHPCVLVKDNLHWLVPLAWQTPKALAKVFSQRYCSIISRREH
jgi:hypothetical protein